MKHEPSRVFFSVAFGLLASTVFAQDPADPQASAKTAVENFFTAWNTGDIDTVRPTLNAPHITLFGARMILAQTTADFQTDFAAMREREGWARSSFDAIEYHSISPAKVHCTVAYTRYNAEGAAYDKGTIFYAMTNKDGHWGMQFRTPTATTRDDAAELTARKLLDDFYVQFNNADNAALQKLTNYPHAFITAAGAVTLAETPDALVMNFDRMREQEGWHHSTLDSAELISSAPGAVVFDIVFSRHHADGTKYSTVPAVWIVTNNEGHWGLQVRSLQPATFRLE